MLLINKFLLFVCVLAINRQIVHADPPLSENEDDADDFYLQLRKKQVFTLLSQVLKKNNTEYSIPELKSLSEDVKYTDFGWGARMILELYELDYKQLDKQENYSLLMQDLLIIEELNLAEYHSLIQKVTISVLMEVQQKAAREINSAFERFKQRFDEDELRPVRELLDDAACLKWEAELQLLAPKKRIKLFTFPLPMRFAIIHIADVLRRKSTYSDEDLCQSFYEMYATEVIRPCDLALDSYGGFLFIIHSLDYYFKESTVYKDSSTPMRMEYLRIGMCLELFTDEVMEKVKLVALLDCTDGVTGQYARPIHY